MRSASYFAFVVLMFAHLTAVAQCEDQLRYDKSGNLASPKYLKGYLSDKDTAVKIFLQATLAKTELTSGITLFGYFGKIGIIDNSTRVKIIFQDNTSVTLSDYLNSLNPNSLDNNNDYGFFTALITGKFDLLLLKTKPVAKIQVTGARIAAMTYLVDGLVSIDFLSGMDCLEQYL